MMNIACSTCLESFTSGCDISTTPCGHVFHTSCITRWLNVNTDCPQCRKGCEIRQIIKLFFSESQSAIEENITMNELERLELELKGKTQKWISNISELETELTQTNQKCNELEREKLLMKLDWSKTEWNLKESLKEANKQISDMDKEQRLTNGFKERQVELQYASYRQWRQSRSTKSNDNDARAAFGSRASKNGGSRAKQILPPLFISTTLQELGSGFQKLVGHGLQVELLHQAKVLCDQQDYVDLTFYCEDGVVRAHQMVLAGASPFLEFLFQTHKWESPLCELEDIGIILPETKVSLVQALIHFVYTGYVVSKEDNFYSLMKLIYSLNINASIEAESTPERPTVFSPLPSNQELID